MKKCYIHFKETLFTKILIVSMAFLFTSCYSEYLSIGYSVRSSAAVWNDKHTKVAFVASKQATRDTKGFFTTFFRGGSPLFLLEDVGLYVFDYENKLLEELVNLKDLASSISTYVSNVSYLNVTLALTDTMVYYLVSPKFGWDWKYYHIPASIKEKYEQPYAFNMHTKTATTVDSTTFNNLVIKSEKCDPILLKKELAQIPLADWGLKLQELYPKSDRKYIIETIYLYNTSSKTRRAVVEQIIAKKSKAKIESILKEMDDYRNNLEEPWKTLHEIESKDIYEQIRALL